MGDLLGAPSGGVRTDREGVAERRAVVIEDDEDIRGVIAYALGSQGFEVRTAGTGLEGVDLVHTFDPDLVTLDLGLPGIDGIEACRRIRRITDAYLVIVTARGEEVDRLLGLETGADDFLTKPFSLRELQARVNAMFRRPRRGHGHSGPPGTLAARSAGASVAVAHPAHEVLHYGVLRLDVEGRQAFRGADELALTRTEFDLLTHLMRSPHRVWSREALLRSVWDTAWATDTHLVEVHVGNLRRKLTGGAGGPATFIKTVRGVGYRMEPLDT
ncbi:response regulator transcription factor [Nocardioides sp. GXZ039]|uniref:response regulator transcription factor n=1 Tax=Nocardioides sp. GXZ039 TaxID=3136018 RepID=UPI0030F41C2D